MFKVIKGKELQNMIDNQEICLRCGLDRKVIKKEHISCKVYGKVYKTHIYK